jgi:hypothetical protein
MPARGSPSVMRRHRQVVPPAVLLAIALSGCGHEQRQLASAPSPNGQSSAICRTLEVRLAAITRHEVFDGFPQLEKLLLQRGSRDSAAAVRAAASRLRALDQPPARLLEALGEAQAGFTRLAVALSHLNGLTLASVRRRDFRAYGELSATVLRACRAPRGSPASSRPTGRRRFRLLAFA